MKDLISGITLEKVTETLIELVNTPSISKQEQLLAEKISLMCSNMGLESTIDNHGNVIAKRNWSKAGIRLALNSHMDTVDVGDRWTKAPFKAEVIDGKLYGLGACDCKASMAAMLLAIEAIQNSNLDLSGELCLTAVVQEEVQSENAKGTVKLIRDGFQADMVIVGEPTNLNICLGCEGMIEVEVVTKGVPVHASNAEKGVNAIQHMVCVINEINKIKPGYHPLLGNGSINAGVITGGLRSSVVPDSCSLKIGRFIVKGESGQSFLEEVQGILNKLKEEDATFIGTAKLTYNSNAAIVDEQEPVVSILKKASKDVLKIDVPVIGTRAHLDSDFLVNMADIPSVALGPGDMKKAHEADEFVVLEDVVKAAHIYAYAIAYALQAH